ncbi:hypothetical protein EKO23_03690 [Nocardioides guangzhouensis]|uniref:Uncharacterized protein n=1 Tax=Nocardioides guangzhouensis TaxID=2497878 RepID=A0A4Q4ZKC2_9ACTN|nr:hypothetical protein [Nocardioides guangzhouensis]RYP87966.1 hypothetical protein EKO23_03690 [Nocardioides guangzhouensis]
MGKFFLAVAVIAVIIYVVTRLIETRGRLFRSTPSRRPLLPPRNPGRPIGPDDDPDFLRDLNRRRKRHEDEA